MTIDEAIESMRLAVNEPAAVQCQQMRVLADVWRDHEATVVCDWCRGSKRSPPLNPWGMNSTDCPACHGFGVVSNGNAARGDALELLGECGKVGYDRFGYDDPLGHQDTPGNEAFVIPHDWWHSAEIGHNDAGWSEIVPERLALLGAYAAADQETRERWAAETRALVPKAEVVCEGCYGSESHGFAGNGNWRRSECPNCHGTGKVTLTEVTR